MKKSNYFKTLGLLLFALPATSNAASLISGYTTGSGSKLLLSNGGTGSTLFTDSAAPGGSQDVVAAGTAAFNSVLLPGDSLWSIGDTVSVTGVALVLRGNVMGNGNFTFDIRQGSGGTGASGAAGLSVIGSATASYTTTSAVDTMYVNFDTPVNFVVDSNSTTIGINFAFDGGDVSYKAGTELSDGLLRYNHANGNIVGGATPSLQRFSVAGSVVPEPSTALLGAIGALALLRRRR